MVGFDGVTPDPEFVDFLRCEGVRSVILFARNLRSANQGRELIEELRSLVPWNLLIAVDQEGGAVTRLSQGVTTFPGNRALGVSGSVDLAFRQGVESGRQLAGIGFDLNLAPVVDVNTIVDNPGIGIRSFGDDVEVTIELANALVQGHLESGVHSCLKHFPGKGAAQVDAHFELPVIDLPLLEVMAVHVEPFRRLANSVSAVMSSHVVVPALDDTQPATYSGRVVRQLLREELAFDGLLIADDLQMGALSKLETVPNSTVRAAAAGHDLLPVCHDLEQQKLAARALHDALHGGELSMDEHQLSMSRIIRLGRTQAFHLLGSTAEGDEVARRIAAESIVALGDPNGICPLDGERPIHLLAMESDDFRGVFEPGDDDWISVAHRLLVERTASPVQCSRVGADGQLVGPIVEDNSVILCLTWNLSTAPRALRTRMIDLIHGEKHRVVVVHVRDPFDHRLLEGGVTSFITHGFRNCQLQALFDVILPPQR